MSGGSYQQYEYSSGNFKEKAQLIASNVTKISQNVSSLERLLSSSHSDSNALSQINSITSYTKNLANDTAVELKNLQYLRLEKSEKLQRDKLTNEFTGILNSFQKVQRTTANHEKQQLQEFKHEMEIEPLPPPTSNQAYRLTQMQAHEDEQQIQELREREEAIRQLETDILDVNQIFRELATLVHEQGDTIDSIEANIESTAVRVTEGTEQLRKAGHFQNAARKKQCFMLGVGAVILLVLILVIYFSS